MRVLTIQLAIRWERERERGLVDQSWEMIKFANLLLAIEANRYRLRSLNGSGKYEIYWENRAHCLLLWMCPVPTGTAPVNWSQWCHWWCDNLQQMKTSVKLYQMAKCFKSIIIIFYKRLFPFIAPPNINYLLIIKNLSINFFLVFSSVNMCSPSLMCVLKVFINE